MSPTVDYAALVHDHRAHLWALAYRITGVAAEADDVVQETFRRAIEHPPLDVERPWRPWLARVATNVAVDTLRRRIRHRYVGPWLPGPIETDDAGDRLADGLDVEARYGAAESATLAFLVALEVLTPRQRAVLVLCDALGYSGPEVAEILGMSSDNVRMTLHRARKAVAGYDEDRCRLSPELRTRMQAALARFGAALGTGDPARVAACLADDVRAVNDGGGQVRSALKVVAGADAVARLYLGLMRRGGSPTAVLERTINGVPALAFELPLADERSAQHALLWLELDERDAIRTIHVLLAPAKLGGIAFPVAV
ncbi:MAG TPA: sigma-70 family RNA polymerase sigma factor [Nannocystaceae bacterium]|nr:sigma-70 family RNA polymerase sigma factor [Nannocystaceae bacterium]